jgi:hypothetical protein
VNQRIHQRYDAEGGAGILNIIPKKENQGFNGVFIASTGIPETYGIMPT